MDIEAGTPMQEDALFRIYSMTKPIVSVALMMLYEEGLCSLNDPVAKYIPAFQHVKVYEKSTEVGLKLVEQEPVMTLYHLLTHTSGLSYGWYLDSPVEAMYRSCQPSLFRRDQKLADVVEQLAQLPLLFQPGTQWRYSHASDVLGHVVQIIADMPLVDFLQERIFKPLGMVDTDFYVPQEKVHRLAQMYMSPKLVDPVVPKPVNVPLIGDVTIPTDCPTGGSGLVSTLADYLKFCDCLVQNGRFEKENGRLLSRKTIEWMTSNHIPDSLRPLSIGPNNLDIGFGLGFRVVTSLGQTRYLTSVGEYGWAGAAKTFFWIDPTEEFVGIMMTQHFPTDPYPPQEIFMNLAYQAIDD